MLAVSSFVSAVLGGLVVGVASLGGVLLSNWGAAHRDKRQDERALRDARRERLRPLYVDLVDAADFVHYVTFQRRHGVGDGSETSEQRDERLNGMLRQATSNLVRVEITLSVESDAAPILSSFKEMWELAARIKRNLEANALSPGVIPLDRIRKATEELDAAVPKLVEAAKAHLAQLERPL